MQPNNQLYCRLPIKQFDVVTSFLNGPIKTKTYVKQPPGFEENTDQVWELQKFLYDLKESPKNWFHHFQRLIHLRTQVFHVRTMLIFLKTSTACSVRG